MTKVKIWEVDVEEHTLMSGGKRSAYMPKASTGLRVFRNTVFLKAGKVKRP